ncbi:MAG: ATP synthase F1 subunit epsilon [Myxococcota bacterium]
MAGKLNVSVVTPRAASTRKGVDAITAPSKMGEVTILPDHIPLVAELDAGVVTIRSSEGVDMYAVSGGFLEVERENVIVLADTAERPEEVDVAKCEESVREATAALKTLDGYDPEYQDALDRIKRNEARLRVAGN